MALKSVYRLLFCGGQNLRAALARAQSEFTSGPARLFWEFVASGCQAATRNALWLQDYALARMNEHMQIRYGRDYDA